MRLDVFRHYRAIAGTTIVAVAVLAVLGIHRSLRANRSVAKLNAMEARDSALKQFAAMPLFFEPNQGQTDPSVRYLTHSGRYSLFLTGDATVFSITGGDLHKGPSVAKVSPPPPETQLIQSAVRVRMIGSNPNPTFEGLEPLPGRVNYLIGGDPSKYQRDVPTFGRVKAVGIYPGVDLVYYGTHNSLEYDLIAAPGADVSRLKFVVEGPAETAIDADGNLRIATAAGTVLMHKPTIYQEDSAGERIQVDGSFILAKDGTIEAGVPRREVALQVANYDHGRTLVIDPGVQIVYSTYLGGHASSTGPVNLEQFSFLTANTPLQVADVGLDVALDPTNKAYVTGVAYSTDFPTKGAFQSALKGANAPPDQNPNSFVSKFDTSQSGAASLIYSTYVGGNGDTNPANAGHGNGDLAFGIAADATGQAFIVGQTYSKRPTDPPAPKATDPTRIPFPMTNTCGAFGQGNNGKMRSTNVGFVAKLNAAGNNLVYSCYIDGINNATEAASRSLPLGCGGTSCKAYCWVTQSDSTTGFRPLRMRFRVRKGERQEQRNLPVVMRTANH